MILFRLLLILSLSAAAPLNPNVKKEATEEDLVTDDISGVNGGVGDGINNHTSLNTSQNTNRDAKHLFYGGNIKFSGTIDSTGNHAHINIGSISNNAAVQDHHHEPDASQEVKPEPKPIDLDNSSPCSFNGALLSAPVVGPGQASPRDTRLAFLWENNIIPYYYSDQNTKVADKNLIRSVMNTIETKTCFEFQEIKEDYEDKNSLEINIKPELCSGGVTGAVDPVKGHLRLLFALTAQVTKLNGEDCGYKGLILHELMHVLGVGHTQRRSDRDFFITVNWENLKGSDEKIKDQYRKCENCELELVKGIDYDCDSIMHYGTHYDGKVVIEVIEAKKDTCKLSKYGGKEASSTDWKLLNIIGKCKVCTADQFSCLSGQQCIDMDFKCDGEKECADGSDEINCEKTGDKKLWRDDGRCGTDYPLDNGEKGQCDPYGISPCCSRWGHCGNTADHCYCSECVNYRVCAADQFTCSSGDCIEQGKRCDGVPDCGDKSDESKCIVSGGDIEFRAENGENHQSKRMGVYLKTDKKIRRRPVYQQKEQKLAEKQFLFFSLEENWRVGPNTEKADGVGLKNEWKDEKMINETTPPKNGWLYWDVQKGEWISDTSIQIREVCADGQFSCVSGECIYQEMRCDGDKDCLDGSDEEIDECQLIACGTGNHFFCSGKCIKENKKCDGFWDCANGEDEINCQEQGYEKLWRDDLKCGKDNPLPGSGKPGQCDPIHGSPCCSSWGHCGNSEKHCKCPTCVNYRDGGKPEDEGEEEEDGDDLGCSFNDDILADKVLPSGQMSPHSADKQKFKWENNKINYYFKPEPRASDRKVVQQVMKTIKEKTCFKFVEKHKQLDTWDKKHSLEIRINSGGCHGVSGSVDKKIDSAGLLLIFTGKLTDQKGKDCFNKGLILHELMHVLGVGHTQRRSDRDYSITVYDKKLKNLGLNIKKQYKVCGKCELYPSIGYDCDSIMHYGTHYNQMKIMEAKYENCTLLIKSKMYLEKYQDGTDKDWELLNIIGKERCPRKKP